MDKERQQMVQLMGKTVGHVFEELDIVYRQHPEVQNDKHFHTALALLQGIQCMTWELENEEKPPVGGAADGQTGKSLENEYPSLF